MTPSEISDEWKYRFEERMSILTDGQPVTPSQRMEFERMAMDEADAVVESLKLHITS